MPSSRSCSDVRLNSDSHVGNLLACWPSPRPISVRNVCTFGTNGVGGGIFGTGGGGPEPRELSGPLLVSEFFLLLLLLLFLMSPLTCHAFCCGSRA